MNKYIEKICQKMADKLIEKMKLSNSVNEVDRLFDIGMMLNNWCLKRGIELN